MSVFALFNIHKFRHIRGRFNSKSKIKKGCLVPYIYKKQKDTW